MNNVKRKGGPKKQSEVRQRQGSKAKMQGNAHCPTDLNTERVIHSLGMTIFSQKKSVQKASQWNPKVPVLASAAQNKINKRIIQTV